MIPFVVRGETRIPPEIGSRLSRSALVDGIAASLRAQGAEDVTVHGDAVAFTVPKSAPHFGEGQLHPATAGVVELRDRAGEMVMAYRLRVRTSVTSVVLYAAGMATFSALAWSAVAVGVLAVALGLGVAWDVASVKEGVPRGLLLALADDARRLSASPPAGAVASTS